MHSSQPASQPAQFCPAAIALYIAALLTWSTAQLVLGWPQNKITELTVCLSMFYDIVKFGVGEMYSRSAAWRAATQIKYWINKKKTRSKQTSNSMRQYSLLRWALLELWNYIVNRSALLNSTTRRAVKNKKASVRPERTDKKGMVECSQRSTIAVCSSVSGK